MQWLNSFSLPPSCNQEFLLFITPTVPRDSLCVYHNLHCVPFIYINVMLPWLSRMTREAARFKQGVGSRRGAGGAELALRDQAIDSRKTGRGISWGEEGWLRTGVRVVGGSARDGPDPMLYWRNKGLEEAAAGPAFAATFRTVLIITDCAKRTHCQMLPLNSTPIFYFNKHLVNTNMYKTLCWVLGDFVHLLKTCYGKVLCKAPL